MFERFRGRSRNGPDVQARPTTMPVPAIRALEPRFVFDGAAAPAAAQAHSDAAAQSHVDGADTAHAEPADKQAVAPAAATPGHETASASGRHEIVVIDKGVADLATLLAGVPASAEVILIDSAKDGFDQLAEALKGRSDIDAIHILSHGSAGDLRLGTGELTAATIQGRYAADLAVIGRALTATGDLLIYGCDFAAGETGARAAALLAQATGADVAASNDATGHAELGGDWDLEVHDGAIETGVVIGEEAQRDWHNLLAAGADNGRGALLAVSGRTIYSVDIATGKATAITTAPATIDGVALSNQGLNSLAVDQANGLIYYVDGSTAAGNKALFAYDFVNNQHFLVDSDLSDNGVTIGSTGVGGAGAAFGRGALYLAVENVSGSNDQIYRITFSNNGRTVAGGTSFGAQITRDNEWGDITIDSVNNQLISMTSTSYTRYNLTTGAEISFAAGNRNDFQAGIDQGGFVYTVGSNITRVNPTDGVAIGTGRAITTNGSTALTGIADAASWTPPTSTIGGSVFADSNTDGTRNTGEAGLRGITVDLVDDVNGNGTADAGERVLATDTTDASGAYRFTGILPGQFVVRVTDTENRLATASATTATSGAVTDSRVGATVAGPNFGYNPALVIDLDASAGGTGYATRYTENGAGVAIVDNDVTITDSLYSNLNSAQARIENGRAGDVLAVEGALPPGITASYDAATYTLTLTGSASIGDYQTALEQIRYRSTSDDPTALTRTVAITVNDTSINSNTARASVAVDPVNDAPVNGVPGTQSVNEDTTLVFSSANGNAITVSDADAGTASLSTTISVANGTLRVVASGGVTVTGNGTGTIRLTGSADAINATLDGTTYRPAANYNGADTLTVVTDDNGNSGQGGAMNDRDTVGITVAPVNDAPVNGLPASQSVNEDANLVFSTAGGNALTVSDVDAGGGSLTTTLSVQHGSLTLGGTANVTVTGSGTGTITLSGTVADINAALDGTVYRASPNYNGADTLTMTTDDGGNTGAGGRMTDTDTLALTVVAVADPPDSTVPAGTQAATEDTPLIFSAANGNQASVRDVDGNGLTVTLSSAQGLLTLSRLTGLTFTAGDGTGDATMTFSGSETDINAALDGLRFDPSADFNGAAGITLVARGPTRTADNFTNGGFENPVISSSTFQIVPDSTVPGWSTDASDQDIEIWKSGYQGVTAFEGNQFAEINANQVAALFQNFDAAAGSKIVLDFAHRGRQGVDTMQVLVTDLGADGVLGGGDDRVLLDKMYSDGNTAWGAYHEELAQGASGNTLRFEFRSISAAGGSPSIGNFVDGIRIQQAFETASNIQVNVASVADIVPDNEATDEDTAVTFNALTGAGGASRDNFESSDARVTSITQPSRGSVVFQPDGTMTYTPAADFNGTDSFTYTVTSGGTTETSTVTVDVRAVNDAPVNGVPGPQAVDEDADLVLSSATNNAITVSDRDAGGAPVSTTLGVGHGTLTLADRQGVTITGSGTGSVTLVGTITDINAALDGIRYRGNANYNGPDSLTVTTDDRGNTGSGGARSDTDTVALDVRPVADPPTNTVPAATQTVNEDTPLVFSTARGNGISVADPDGGSLTVTLSSAEGVLTLSQTTGLTFLQGDGIRDGTVRFSGTISDINAALEGLRFDPNADVNGPAQIALTSAGADGFSAASTVSIAITPVADIVPDSVATDEDTAITFDPIAGTNGASPDNFEDGGRAVSAVTQGANGRVSLAPNGMITYTPDADFNGTDSFTYTVTSGGTTETATVTVEVRAVNDAPVNSVPGAQAVDEDADLVFSADNRNAITISDRDAGGAPVSTTLGVQHGTLTLGVTSGVTITGSGTGSVTLVGTITDINAALDGLRYRGDLNYNGADALTITTDDGGNTGSGGVRSDTDTVALDVRPVADPPTNTVPAATQMVDEDTPLVFSAAGGNGISVADPDGGSLTVTLSSAQGVLTLSRTTGLTFLQGSGTRDGTVRFSGTIADINAALEGLRFDPNADVNGPAQIALTTGGADGFSAASTVSIAITPVADIVPDNVATDEDTAISFDPIAGTNGASSDNFEDGGRAVSAVTQGANGSVSLAQDGTITYTPNTNFNGTDSFSYTVTSGGTTETATVTVTVRAVNDAPVNRMPADQGLAEDTPLVFSTANGNRIAVSDVDALGRPITTTLSVLHGTLTLGSTTGVTVVTDGSGSVTLTGTVDAINAALDGTTYRPSADYNGGDTLTIRTDDGGNTGSGGAQSDTDAIALTIAAVNDAPRAGFLPAIGSLEGDAVTGADLGRYFSDIEGDRLAFTSTGLPPGLTIDPATGLVSGTIDRSASRGGVNGDYTVTVTADDGNGGITNRSFVWRVVNPAPIARNDGAVVDAATPVTGSVLADNGNGPDSDPDGDPLTVAAVNGQPANVGQPVAGSAGGRFTVLGDGTYRFDPGSDFADLAPGETRTTRITYTVSDGDGGTAEASVAVTVTGRNVPLAALAPGDRALADGQTVALPLGGLFADPDGRGLTFGATGLPSGLSIDLATGAVTGTVDRAASGVTGLADYRVTITATDPQGTTTERSFTLRVTNPPPQAADDSATTVEDTPVTIDVLANDRDSDGDTLAIVATGDAAPSAGHGRVAAVDGRLVYTPDPNFNGTDTITYTITDGNGGTSTASVAVTVSPADDAPDAGILPDQFGRDGAPVRYDIASRFRDADTDPSVVQAPTGDSLRFAATGLPPGLSIDPATGLITGTLPSDASAASRYTVTVTATDASGASLARDFIWTVSNDAPLAAPDTATTREGTMVLVAVTANDGDPDGDPIRLVDEPGAASAAHGSVTVDPATGLLAYTPEPGFSGRDTIVYTIVDAQGGRATGILTVTVTPVNDRPVAPEPLPGRNVADGETVRVPLGNLITDPDGDQLAYSVTGLPPGLTIDPATGEITGTIDRAASGPTGRATYVVTLSATDPAGLAVTRSFAWTVTNPAPVAVDDAIATAEDTPVDIDVTTNDTDPDGDPLSVVPGSMAAGHGSVTLNPDGSLRYVPDPDFNGTDRIVYTITDGNGGFATAFVTITVTPVNDAPVFDPASPALADRAANDADTVAIPAGSAFRDVDAGERLTFSATGLPPGLSVDPATGLISGTIASDASGRAPGGVYTIVLTATDTGGATATARLTITVANPAPIAVDDDATLAEDGVLTGSVLGNDRDPDGDALRVDPVPVSGPAHGRLDLRPDGTFTYTPDPDFHGADAFTYTLVDSDGGRSTATVHLTVDSVNDAPTASADPLTLPANTVGTGRVVATDRDGDAVSFRLTGQPANGTVTLAADGSYAYRPFAAFSGADSFVVAVDDGNGGTTLVTVSVTITPNPVMVPPSAMIPILSPPPLFLDRPAAPPVLPLPITVDGIVLPAVAEIDTLGSVGDVILADGAVVAAVNGVGSLHGTTILIDHPVMLDENDRIARLSWERFERVPVGETPWFSPRPYLGRSLGVSLTADAEGFGTNDLMVEAIRRPDVLAINLRNYAPGLETVTAVRLFGIDGAPRPDWIESDGRGGFWGRPPAGTGLVRIEMEIELEDGRLVRRPLSVDAETGEIRALPSARPAGEPKPHGTRDAEPAPRREAPLFTTQLATLGERGAQDLALIERALSRGL